ncbi:MAG: chloride channel protein [Bacteroidales bacterium]
MFKRIFKKIHYWRTRYISNHTFVIISASIVGIVSALAAVLLKTIVNYLHEIPKFFQDYETYNLWLIIFPVSGILISIFIIKVLFKSRFEKGLGSILYSISHKSSKIEGRNTYSHLITSGITVGLGGSAGLEAPIVITGSAIGSNISDFFSLGQKERTLLLACGAASGIAAVFNSPIAGVIFALEVLLYDFAIPTFIPLLISTASATIVSKLLYSGQLFYLISNNWYFHAIPFYIALGILCGFLSVYMQRITLKIEGYFGKKPGFLKISLGVFLLGSIIFVLPPLFGEGYTSIEILLKGNFSEILNNSLFGQFSQNPWFILIFVGAIILTKVIATALTIGSGGNGGIFAPSLFTGAFMGFGLSYFVNTTGISDLNISNFIVVGMAGVLSGVVHAPLTAIFLIAEITGGYVLFVPLMIVSALAYFTTRIFEPHSIYTKSLALKGYLMTDDKDSNVLMTLKVADLIEKDFVVLNQNDSLRKLITAFSNSNRTLFPVVNDENEIVGVIYLYKVKDLLFKSELYDSMIIRELVDDIIKIEISENMESVMTKFEKSNLWNIPVVETNHYVGFISRSNIFTYYRRTLKKTKSFF